MTKYIKYMFLAGISMLAVSCDKYLDKIPDNRAELNTSEKITSLLVSAYPNKFPGFIFMCAADNVMDCGAQWGRTVLQEEAYLWKDITGSGNDNTRYLWQTYYNAIAHANQALAAIDEMGGGSELNAQKGEALICRAYGHFVLANIFCMPYNEATADKDLGLPFCDAPETKVLVDYERGTMRELYQKIEKDILEGLPLIDDNNYEVPKYHFNKKAAYSFAARFYLFYMKPDLSNLDKVIEYTSAALGAQPTALLRNMAQYTSLGAEDIANAYVQAKEPANFLLLTNYSVLARLTGTSYPRYSCDRIIISNDLFWAKGPWGSGSSANNNSLVYGRKLYKHGADGARFPKFTEFWEDPGYAHVVYAAFTADDALLMRAEAYALKKEYDKSMEDLTMWYNAKTLESFVYQNKTYKRPVFNRKVLNDFMAPIAYTPVPTKLENGKDRTIKKTLHPLGFTVEEGEQENFIQFILHCRRLEGFADGTRWLDIRRYGIEISHNISGSDPIILTKDDPRRAFQLPSDVIDAGLPANPRNTKATTNQ